MAAVAASEPYDGHVEELHPVDEDDRLPVARPSPQRLSTLRLGDSNIVVDDGENLEILLEADETATFIGEYDLAVLQGVVTVYGTVIRPDSPAVRIYAPSTQALPQIQARQAGTTVRLSSTRSGIRKLESLSPLFRNIWTPSPTDRSFALLGSSTDDPLQRILEPLEISRETDAVLRVLSAKSSVDRLQQRVMAVGAKSSGKSTFNRLLWNHLRSWTSNEKCHFLDIDPGQPEFGPPGLISLVEVSNPLLGPPFTHPATAGSPSHQLLRSHAIAATSFKEDPDHYKACVLDLATHSSSKYPVIINSCGWVTGTGADILKDLIDDLAITDVVLLEPLDPDLFDFIHSNSGRMTVHRIPRRQPKPSSRTPAEQRAMRIMAYFHARTSSSRKIRWSGKAINTLRPWVVSYAGETPGVLAVLSYTTTPAPDFLAEVLDGSIVALNILNSSDESALILTDVQRTPEEIPFIPSKARGHNFTLDPTTSHCITLALVRAIDTANKNLHLVVPLPEAEIVALNAKKVVLVRGFETPEWAYLEDVYRPSHAGEDEVACEQRPWVSERGPVGVEGAVWRLRHPPMAGAVGLSRGRE